jgi:glutamyl-tRNA reductase
MCTAAVCGPRRGAEKVGFIGLGNMGKGMAKNLIEKVEYWQLS